MQDKMIVVTQTGEVCLNFMPTITELMTELSFKGKKDGEIVVIRRKEWHPVVSGYELIRLDEDKARRMVRWEVRPVSQSIFWEVFDDQWERVLLMEIGPGLNILVFYVYPQNGAQAGIHWSGKLNRLDTNQEIFTKLQSLRSSDSQDQFRDLMKRIGNHLSVMCMLGNFVEWTIMGCEAGQKPSLRVPYPKITKDDVLGIARGTKASLELGLATGGGLLKIEKETRAVIAYIDGLEEREFSPRRTLSKLIYLCWGLWPIWSNVHDGIDDWFLKKVYQELEAAVSS